ncbi:exosome complex component RRP45A-like isoform X2 [Chenopodium quinoa]|nr:exosome complex component RRP45A-like isoform X2 [Chenopodium quinoa]XP_021771005.1 exosome complex component RRP45A-like isoform X2 [Chenopodium quinoa]XP_021771007.1 exosome complex component RRP45A-like isoform X2 [Chenopodium quinoa]
MSFVTAQLVQPYRDRPNEGSLNIYTEFSPMADPSFEAGRPGESAIELGRIIDRGLRESRAVDTESLCVLAGKLVWSVRLDLHILDNGGNLLDAANVAALASLMTFRRPVCTLGGEDGQEVVVHPPEVQEPLPLIVHHLPIAVTFGFMTENILVVDPTYYEEAVMKGKLTATINASEDVCAIQKAGEIGVAPSVVMQCLRIAAAKAADLTSKIENAVKLFNTDREQQSVKRLSSAALLNISTPNLSTINDNSHSICEQTTVLQQMRKSACQERYASESNVMKTEEPSCREEVDATTEAKRLMKGPSCWDPFSRGVDSKHLKASLVSCGKLMEKKENEQIVEGKLLDSNFNPAEILEQRNPIALAAIATDEISNPCEIKTLQDAVKPKSKRKKFLLRTQISWACSNYSSSRVLLFLKK